MLCWWGIWTLCISPAQAQADGVSASARAAQYGAVVSPVFTVLLLMCASGVPTAEKPQARRFFLQAYPPLLDGDGADGERARLPVREPVSAAWANYRRYRARTSILVPLPPALYRRLPRVVKKTVLLDWPIYEFRAEDEGLKGGGD
ncbi:hypothetical protein B0H21DRAFT_584905 [Amylocystis lapponica]|nr:hypothetical protein B0H21DRAFT_584905 [Amylocystis lapponica]